MAGPPINHPFFRPPAAAPLPSHAPSQTGPVAGNNTHYTMNNDRSNNQHPNQMYQAQQQQQQQQQQHYHPLPPPPSFSSNQNNAYNSNGNQMNLYNNSTTMQPPHQNPQWQQQQQQQIGRNTAIPNHHHHPQPSLDIYHQHQPVVQQRPNNHLNQPAVPPISITKHRNTGPPPTLAQSKLPFPPSLTNSSNNDRNGIHNNYQQLQPQPQPVYHHPDQQQQQQQQAERHVKPRETEVDDGRDDLLPIQADNNNNMCMDLIPCSTTNGGIKVHKQAAKTWEYPSNVAQRQYQLSAIECALLHNTLVCLPTGLGKTLIAAVVMHNFARWFPEGKIVFIAPTRPLVEQQIHACRKCTGMTLESVQELTGKIDSESRKEAWHTDEKRFFFATPQTFWNDVKKGICPYEKVTCIVIDECHRSVGDADTVLCIKFFKQKKMKFRVLALSATPGSTVPRVQEVIDNLMISSVQCRTETDPQVKEFVFKKAVDVEIVVDSLNGPESGLKGELLGLLQLALGKLAAWKAWNGVINAEYVTAFGLRQAVLDQQTPSLSGGGGGLQQRSGYNNSNNNNNNNNNNSYNSNNNSKPGTGGGKVAWKNPQAVELLTQAAHIATARDLLLQEGPGPALKFLKGKEKDGPAAMKTIRASLPGYLPFMNHLTGAVRAGGSSPKMRKLIDILTKHFSPCSSSSIQEVVGGGKVDEDDDATTTTTTTTTTNDTEFGRVIVFTSLRESVENIVKALEEHSPLIRARPFVGQSVGATGGSGGSGSRWRGSRGGGSGSSRGGGGGRGSSSTTRSGGGGKGMTQKDQKKVLKDFKESVINVLVATCIGEEGLDIPAVDLIVCFDAAASPVRSAQREGRTGRHGEGRIVYILSQGREEEEFTGRQAALAGLLQQLGQAEMNFQLHAPNPRMLPRAFHPQRRDVLLTNMEEEEGEEGGGRGGGGRGRAPRGRGRGRGASSKTTAAVVKKKRQPQPIFQGGSFVPFDDNHNNDAMAVDADSLNAPAIRLLQTIKDHCQKHPPPPPPPHASFFSDGNGAAHPPYSPFPSQATAAAGFNSPPIAIIAPKTLLFEASKDAIKYSHDVRTGAMSSVNVLPPPRALFRAVMEERQEEEEENRGEEQQKETSSLRQPMAQRLVDGGIRLDTGKELKRTEMLRPSTGGGNDRRAAKGEQGVHRWSFLALDAALPPPQESLLQKKKNARKLKGDAIRPVKRRKQTKTKTVVASAVVQTVAEQYVERCDKEQAMMVQLPTTITEQPQQQQQQCIEVQRPSQSQAFAASPQGDIFNLLTDDEDKSQPPPPPPPAMVMHINEDEEDVPLSKRRNLLLKQATQSQARKDHHQQQQQQIVGTNSSSLPPCQPSGSLPSPPPPPPHNPPPPSLQVRRPTTEGRSQDCIIINNSTIDDSPQYHHEEGDDPFYELPPLDHDLWYNNRDDGVYGDYNADDIIITEGSLPENNNRRLAGLVKGNVVEDTPPDGSLNHHHHHPQGSQQQQQMLIETIPSSSDSPELAIPLGGRRLNVSNNNNRRYQVVLDSTQESTPKAAPPPHCSSQQQHQQDWGGSGGSGVLPVPLYDDGDGNVVRQQPQKKKKRRLRKLGEPSRLSVPSLQHHQEQHQKDTVGTSNNRHQHRQQRQKKQQEQQQKKKHRASAFVDIEAEGSDDDEEDDTDEDDDEDGSQVDPHHKGFINDGTPTQPLSSGGLPHYYHHHHHHHHRNNNNNAGPGRGVRMMEDEDSPSLMAQFKAMVANRHKRLVQDTPPDNYRISNNNNHHRHLHHHLHQNNNNTNINGGDQQQQLQGVGDDDDYDKEDSFIDDDSNNDGMEELDDDDVHDDFCAVCGEVGELVCCDSCPSAYHMGCAELEELPKGEWLCPQCCGDGDDGEEEEDDEEEDDDDEGEVPNWDLV